MIREIDMTVDKLAKEVLNLQIPSYKVEADIIGFDDIPPLTESVELLQQSGETFFGYYLKGKLCGVVSFKTDKSVIDIHRLMVHPDHFRKGIASRLLDFIERNNRNYKKIVVSTGTKNVPAVEFYLTNGFSKIGERKLSACLSLTFFEKEI